ncbi:MAG: TonB-dependent receptor, partial [Sphingobacteriales bacterium]
MKKNIFKAILISAASLFANTAFSQAITDTVSLNEVVITSGRAPSKYLETARSITVISAEQLKNMPAKSINEILENFAGVDIRPRGVAGVQADISIRGENFENVLILVDGVRVNDPQTGHHNLNIPVAMEDIDRVEILRGSAARIHGQNAFSGVINFITKKPGDTNVSVKAVVGDFDFFQNQLSISAPVKNYKQNFTLSRSSSNGYRHNTDFGINNLNYRSYIDLPKIAFSTMAGFTGRNFGANAFYAETFPDAYEETKTGFVHLSAETKGNWKVKPNLYWRRNNDEFLLKRGNPAFYHNLHTTDVFGADVNATRNWKLGTTSIGAEGRREQIVSTNLGNHHRYNAGIYAEHKLLFWEKLAINPGVFVSWYSDYDVQFYPGLDVSYLFRPALSVYGTANRSYRVPTYTELYYKDPKNIANPNLKPEEAISYEAGFRFRKKAVEFSGAVYQKQGTNIIDWVRDSTNSPWQVKNYAELTTQGLEVQLAINPVKWFGEKFFIEHFSVQYSAINSTKQSTEKQSKYV